MNKLTLLSTFETGTALKRTKGIIKENIQCLEELLAKPQSEYQKGSLTIYLSDEQERLEYIQSMKKWSMTSYSNNQYVIDGVTRNQAIDYFHKNHMSGTNVLDLGSIYLIH